MLTALPIITIIIALNTIYKPFIHLASILISEFIFILSKIDGLAFEVPKGFLTIGIMPAVVWVFHRIIPKPFARLVSSSTLILFIGQVLARLL